MKIVGYIVAVILIFFGVLFIWGAFSPQGSPGWILVGLVSVGIGLVIIFYASRKTTQSGAGENITLNIDLPGNVKMDSLKCKSCGGTLTSADIQMIAGAPVVTCPFCKSTYQLTEEPKW
jgi:hypothetical protein